MRRSRPGDLVRLTYDWFGPEPPPGPDDYIRSNGGSLYRIFEAHANRRRRGRWTLTCLKMESSAELPATARVEALVWYPREKKAPAASR